MFDPGPNDDLIANTVLEQLGLNKLEVSQTILLMIEDVLEEFNKYSCSINYVECNDDNDGDPNCWKVG